MQSAVCTKQHAVALDAFTVIFPRGRSGGYFPILNSGGYAARYLNPRTSMWISADPAMGDYIPVAPNSDEARKRNENLPGMGGVFNYVNHHAYHYAGNNPVKYVDPTGRTGEPVVSEYSKPRKNSRKLSKILLKK